MTSATTHLSCVAAAIALGIALPATPAAAAGFMYFKDSPIVGESSGGRGRITVDSWAWGATGSRGTSDKWFVADSFGFGVEREMKESGEKGGTEDMNIGVGELQERPSPSRWTGHRCRSLSQAPGAPGRRRTSR